jgi:hypothetical protein
MLLIMLLLRITVHLLKTELKSLISSQWRFGGENGPSLLMFAQLILEASKMLTQILSMNADGLNVLKLIFLKILNLKQKQSSTEVNLI